MADRTQFGGYGGVEPLSCDVCEAMLLDAVDGTLTASEQAAFDRHVEGCATCASLLAEERRGAAWMDMLKGQAPEPPASLLTKILAETTGAQEAAEGRQAKVMAMPAAARARVEAAVPEMLPVAAKTGRVLAWKEKFATALRFDAAYSHFQPRLAMTAAMAFFSIALTMNIGGVRLSDLRPGALHRTIAEFSASASRSIQNMRVVYQVESRLNDLRDDERDPGGPFGESSTTPAAKQQTPDHQPAQKNGQQDEKKPAVPQGTSRMEVPEQLKRAGGSNGTADETKSAAGFDDVRMQEGA